ncbi:MAG TPA: bifunctional 5,10-methylenetetrahydrofolate dehydrogenase/5,10-methenyltetrahydrofolate cyclohydrolase [Patescibacteria group bacterium]|nr:bifunctional 5,10-methylenetetrahydrofolate dehydrogenase/5,10-methenyltetrahydrofolate cyclohydrolase [Patescibacteria group bacterium]
MIIDGRTIANSILENLSQRIRKLQKNYGIEPHLVVIRVGEDPAITSYIAQKEKMAKKIGAIVSVYNFPSNVTEDELKACLDFLQTKTNIHGTILQLPLPPHLDGKKLLLEIRAEKDVDGFRPNSQFPVPIAQAVIKCLKIPYVKVAEKTEQIFDEWLKSKTVIVIGKGKTGGQPVIDALQKKGIHPMIIDTRTEHPEVILKQADIIISAVGKEHVITKNILKKDVILIGIGIHMTDEGKFAGDYNETEIKDIASWYTPVPGGVGPVNVACLMENLVIATENAVT